MSVLKVRHDLSTQGNKGAVWSAQGRAVACMYACAAVGMAAAGKDINVQSSLARVLHTSSRGQHAKHTQGDSQAAASPHHRFFPEPGTHIPLFQAITVVTDCSAGEQLYSTPFLRLMLLHCLTGDRQTGKVGNNTNTRVT